MSACDEVRPTGHRTRRELWRAARVAEALVIWSLYRR